MFVQYADDCAKSKEMAQALLNNIEKCVAVLKEMEHNKPSRRCDMAVNGHDMIALGFQGKEIKNERFSVLILRMKNSISWVLPTENAGITKFPPLVKVSLHTLASSAAQR